MKRQHFQVLVIGAGPAGIAAVTRAAQSGQSVALLDDNPLPGGQIWRQGRNGHPSALASSWLAQIAAQQITCLNSARVIASLAPRTLLIETPGETLEIAYERLILATGARERFLPFPGWTLPGVMGAGGLQALVKGGLPIAGKRVIVAGSGPLLLAVAAYLKSQGARISALVEQAPWSRLRKFARHLLLHGKQLQQAAGFGWQLRGLSYKAGSWVWEAHGVTKLEAVTLQSVRGTRTMLACDYLACGFGLVPNNELAALLGCALEQSGGGVQVDEWQQSSQEAIYCAGEVTGIGGLDLALLEGQIAGLAATGRADEARKLFPERTRAARFAALLEQTFQLRPELKTLAREETLFCRCEDVPYGAVRQHTSWRSAKLHTRCGMGPCQGRVCGAATQFLFGWTQDALRAPLVATPLATLMLSDLEKTREIDQPIEEKKA